MRKLSIALMFAAVAGTLTVCAKSADKTLEPSPVQSAQNKLFTEDATPLDRSNTHQFTSYADMLAKVTPSVVTVTTSSVVRVMPNRSSDPMEEMLRRLYGLPGSDDNSNGGDNSNEDTSQQKRVPNGMGSGVIISSDGYILTNNHVVCDASGNAADEISVTLPDGREMDAKLVGRDPQTDVALIHIDQSGLPALTFADSDNLMVGDIVFAVGNPMGLTQTVTMGIVSAVGRSRLGILGKRGYEDFIQTDAPINPGNSGGALVDAEGRLVGINTAIMSRSGGNIGIGFAIPSAMAGSIVENLMDGGKVERGYLGVSVRDLDPTLAESFGIESGHGTLVEGVTPDSPAEAAGLKRGDVIVSADGREVKSDSDLRIYISQKKPGTKVKLDYIRGGKTVETEATLASLSGTATVEGGGELLPGVMVQSVDDELAKKYGLPNSEGLVITSISLDSPLSHSLAVGMQIVEINDEAVNSFAQAKKLLVPGSVNRMWVTYRGSSAYVGIRVPNP